jgi:hypothetical protein
MALAAEEDHLMFSPRSADHLGNIMGKISRKLDTADLGANTPGNGNDLNLAHWFLLEE